ncbi:peptidoglycan DD-metalloendopeptidase family protein [Paenibacillus sp. NPDC058071]|uniref:peptidoglycan DD-metalloendopeptidase family protein n=1 Tax=Paenibacillus sp. NPDC058071 TaxID=3346326 RepID=UPI0036D88910
MTVFRPKDRVRKAWDATVQAYRNFRPERFTGKKQQQSSSQATISSPWWRKKPVWWTAGLLVVLAAGAGVGVNQYIKANTVDYYNVYMNGAMVGTIQDPSAVDQLIDQETENVKQANPDVTMVLDSGEITYSNESAFKAIPETEQTLGKLQGMFSSHAVGVELKVDGKVIAIVKDQETADAILTRVQTKYAPNLAAAKKKSGEVKALSFTSTSASTEKAPTKNGTLLQEVAFVEQVTSGTVETDPSKIKDAAEVYKQIVQGDIKPTKYTIQKGDCIGCIADKFDISPEVIYDNNRWIEEDKIKAGDVLDLTVLKPEVTVKTVESVTETITIEPPVEVRKSDTMKAGESKVISEGQKGSKRVTYQVVKQNGYLVSEELVSSDIVKEAVASIVIKGTKVVLGEGSGRFAMPVSNWSLSSKYGKRWGRAHKGIDITGSKSILASDDGVISFVGNKNGYGKAIVINHKNGYETLYGHLSSYNVREGQIVEKGDKIGVMGSTGRSTGVHLHFEIHKNGVVQNPLKYL